jgi:CHAD domain-containing protein
MSIEREAKLTASTQVQLPSFDGLVDEVSVARLAERHLDAVYYDTAQLDLARWGITLRHRSGEGGLPWTLKLPKDQDRQALIRRELTFEGPPGAVPTAARELVSAFVRSRALVRVARLGTNRSPLELSDATGQRLGEIVDDRVTAYLGPGLPKEFREIEVEVFAQGRVGGRLLKAAVDRLVAAGCGTDPPIPKLVRALGPRALEPPELIVPPVARKAPVGQLIRHALSLSVVQILIHDPGVRLGDDPEDVHQFRVGIRRMRSDLRTFMPLLEPAPLRELREELRWLGTTVGAVRDGDVLAERLRTQGRSLPEADAPGVQLILSLLASQADSARTAMLLALRSPRYLSLLEALIKTANEPPVRAKRAEQAKRPASRVAAEFVHRPRRRLTEAVASLDDDPTDPALHNIRILAKRCRYAAEAVAPVVDQAARFAAALAELQTVLGEHQDAVVAERWLRKAAVTAPDAAVAAGELVLLQRFQRAKMRAGWPKTWKAVSAKKLSSRI